MIFSEKKLEYKLFIPAINLSIVKKKKQSKCFYLHCLFSAKVLLLAIYQFLKILILKKRV